MSKLGDFIESNHTNEWLDFDNMRVYVRKGKHSFNGELVSTIDIANVVVIDDCQNQGVFTRFLEHAESLGLSVHIENVLTERFANFFRKREGYTIVADYCEMFSFLKLHLGD